MVDDSLTVREMERKLLTSRGYEVEVAVDGVDGWNALRARDYDLVISDVDMPRMDGIEMIGLVKKDARLRSLPVMIVSYKDREEDRRRGLEAGADLLPDEKQLPRRKPLASGHRSHRCSGRIIRCFCPLPLKIAIANDQPIAVEALRRALNTGPAPLHQLTWVARDGEEAVRRCAEDRPDLVLMDLIMPRMDGVRGHPAHHGALALCNSPRQCSRWHAVRQDLRGDGRGRALDVVAAPTIGIPPTEFLAKIEMMGRYIGGGTRKKPTTPSALPAGPPAKSNLLVAIGSSAGRSARAGHAPGWSAAGLPRTGGHRAAPRRKVRRWPRHLAWRAVSAHRAPRGER